MELKSSISANTSQPYDDQAFEQLFKAHFKALHAYALALLKDEDTAEEIVQTMFLKFWEKRELLNIQTSVKAYLYKCVYHDSLNFLKHEKIKTKYQDFASYTMNSHHEPASSKAEMTELEYQIGKALNELPEQCRTIFQMSRFEELKYREIAEQLGLSVKTIENQMGKALRIMRLKLADFLSLILLGLMYYRDFFN
ncbi:MULTISPECIES: RNA polymerase sigma-70 factor [Pedobacter]|uniref:RNA polymerase sigma-70 factor n=1 Tax=Pedobacter heparinus (strain ATCC 13125 / DSM 2366 / CIP 104194 / JCM 7457 / NBRC 12017 / NCIMB 9290 / NRRL B-14731 / HIM 762-3) TaxID=485917 RepID=C6XW61_PEDHD|nr:MULTISPECIES: RNA polymerase sigma-70 factor [Pedobacter]ACU04140.1 RNA polymerase sigma-70 factor [Pedobacter heparinus DSM 2366]MBB5436408.1 RNA polymerase sigma-70 factor (ECF subfamily) [Pedobacter sp. AK017]